MQFTYDSLKDNNHLFKKPYYSLELDQTALHLNVISLDLKVQVFANRQRLGPLRPLLWTYKVLQGHKQSYKVIQSHTKSYKVIQSLKL